MKLNNFIYAVNPQNMIVPLTNELKSIQNSANFQDNAQSNLHICIPNKLYNQISSTYHSNINQYGSIQRNCQQEISHGKKLPIKKKSIKYHNFHKCNKSKKDSSKLSISLSQIINQNDICEDPTKKIINFKNDNQFSFNSIKQLHTMFSKDEDNLLFEIVNKNGPRNWKLISSYIPGRTSRQCRDRYTNYLAPGIDFSKWEKKDDELLIEKYKIYGPKWSEIAKFFPNRTANNIKNRYNYNLCHQIKFSE